MEAFQISRHMTYILTTEEGAAILHVSVEQRLC